MKKILYILCCLSVFTCEDVIELDLNTAEPRLVIDASIKWYKDTSGKNQFIKLSLTAPYYSTEIPPATGATVTVSDQFNNVFNFVEEENSGIYKNLTFIPTIDGVYKLKIVYNNETYTATETLMPVVDIDRVEQKNDTGFSGDETELKAYYSDQKDIKNYYLFEFINIETNIVNIEVYDDKFTDGNQIFAYYSNEDIVKGDELVIQNHGISQRYYEYMVILLQQGNEESGDPFEVQPAKIRGNCINETNPDNYPFGYFRASEVSVFNYTIE
ncbi:DUF4249 domain-containing protein [Mariniflexile sp.]|uniref:DUF4249 domain-containing protein n=1 Tax=Mariniflexile sp. TaxID=1979402 RepID=UPI003562B781